MGARGTQCEPDVVRWGVQGLPVGSLVFAEEAVAGDIWLPDGRRLVLNGLTIVGRRRVRLTARPEARTVVFEPSDDRQVRMFGAERGYPISGKHVPYPDAKCQLGTCEE